MDQNYGYFRIGYSGNVETLLYPPEMLLDKNKLYIIKTKHGLDIARFVGISNSPPNTPPPNKKYSELSFYEDIITLERISSEKEQAQWEEKQKLSLDYLAQTQLKSKSMNLPMDIVSAYLFFTGEKIIFSFTSEIKKIDFRDLAKELGQMFKVKIELHKIYPRDFSALLDELGSCGKRVCCASHKPHKCKTSPINTESITITNSNQIGCCGKPKCCLSF